MSGEVSSVHEAFERTRSRWGDRPFLHIPAQCAGGPADLTYEQAGAAVERSIDGYRRSGYGCGHHVGLLLDNRAEFFVHFLALNAIGATVIPLSSELAPDEAAFLLGFADVDLLVHLPERRQFAERAIRAGRLALTTPASIDAGDAPPASAARGRPGVPGQAAIVFTSGSTGQPKGCVLSNDYFLAFGNWYRTLGGRCALNAGSERLITPLPLNHVNALAFSSMGMMLTGGCIIQLDRFKSSTWWPIVAESRATVMHYLGVMPAMLLQLPIHTDERRHSVRFGFGGGVRNVHHTAFEERFGIPLIEAWAMTETGGAGTISTHAGARHVGCGCIGQPSPRFSEARIIDGHDQTQPVDGVGELVVRATGDAPRQGFFSGYYKDPAATEAAWHGGWLHTGDLARRGSDGSFFFVGRRKQMIRRSGENISAAEVEAVLSADPRIKQVAVVPVPDEIREEEVFACIVVQAGIFPTLEAANAILSAAAERLSYYKLPGYIAFLDALPVTATQKPRYGSIADLAKSLLAARSAGLFDVRQAKRPRGRVS
jgi:acyl-CoA synthetase (AMP-forming)/AMP-acid ligase II